MAILTIKSDNPELSYVLVKNPASGATARKIRSGNGYGWYSDEQTKMNLVAKGKVLKALEDHNENVRAKTLDHAYKGSAREVYLDPIEHLGDDRLQWEIVRVG